MSRKVVPEAPPPPDPAADARMPRAPLLKRLMEIEQTIANIKAPEMLDGYKATALHTACRRGDMREVAALLPHHRDTLTLRDEAGWMPIHHAACAGRRVIFRVPLHQPKMVDLSERDNIKAEVTKLIEAATALVGEAEEDAEAQGVSEVELTFSQQMERALDSYLHSPAEHREAPGLPTGGAPTAGAALDSTGPTTKAAGSFNKRAKKQPPVAVAEPPAAAGPRSSESLERRVEAAAMQQLREERPMGVWVEIKYLPPAKEGQDQGPMPPATAHPNAAADMAAPPRAYLEILLLELHDSEYEAHVPRATCPGALLPNAPLDVAMSAVARGLSIWEPGREDLADVFKVLEQEEEARPENVVKRSLLAGRLGAIAVHSVLRISGIAIDGEKLFGASGASYRDFFVRANLVMRDSGTKGMTEDTDELPMALRVETGVTAKTTTRPKPSSLDWGSESLALEIPGPVQLPAFVQILVRAKDAGAGGVVLGHALVVLDSINGPSSNKQSN